ncbi:MAG: histidinol-phosphatase HisJ family protein [Clostridia bacterium]|nr:histidinol-phosphatase HisJ family protein [Clostridia bacterium]
MSVLSSAHVHTTYCDGKTPAREMAKRAYELGFISLGFTSHAPQTFDPGYCIPPEQEDAYKAEISAVKKEYKGRMAVYTGVERDLYSCCSTEGYDYFIASVHYFLLPDGHHCPIDASPDRLKKYVDEQCGGNGLEMARRYFCLLRDYVLSSHSPVIGHFDLLRKNNAVLHLYDENGAAYRDLSLDCLRPLADTGALLEVNTGAMARGYLSTPYPSPTLLKAWKEWGGEVIINSDCHDARYLTAGYDDAEALLQSLGYDHAVRLGRDTLWERYSLGE